jgi:hypothetical protein
MICLALLPTLSCGLEGGHDCAENADCTTCLRMDGCGYCLETIQCLAHDAVCPGDWALQEDQCTTEEASFDGDPPLLR